MIGMSQLSPWNALIPATMVKPSAATLQSAQAANPAKRNAVSMRGLVGPSANALAYEPNINSMIVIMFPATGAQSKVASIVVSVVEKKGLSP